jgi:hypothetical protein
VRVARFARHTKVRGALGVLLLILPLLSCSAPTEQPLLTQFFAASRLRDLTALRNFSTVVFEPAADGIVTGFDVIGVTSTKGADGRVAPTDVSKAVSISAPVRLPDGQTVLKNFVITMQRGLPGSDQNRWGGWMITAISEGSGSPSTPRP